MLFIRIWSPCKWTLHIPLTQNLCKWTLLHFPHLHPCLTHVPTFHLHQLLLPQRKSNASHDILAMGGVPEKFPSHGNLLLTYLPGKRNHLAAISNYLLPKCPIMTDHPTPSPAATNLSPAVPVKMTGQDSSLLNNSLVPLKLGIMLRRTWTT